MSWKSVDLCRKYTWRTQDGRRHPSYLFSQYWWIPDKIEPVEGTEPFIFCVVRYFGFISDWYYFEKIGRRDVFVRLVSIRYIFYISLQSSMTPWGSFKEKLFSFISYCILFINHSPITCCPNLLAHQSLGPKSLAPRSLALQRSLPDRSSPPITLSPIARLLPPTRSIFFYCPTCSMISWSLFLWFSKNNPKESKWF